MDPGQNFKSLQENLQKALISTVKSVNRVSTHDLVFQRTADPAVGERIQESTARILKLANRAFKASAQAGTGRVNAPKLGDFEDVDLKWHSVVDVIDENFERADVALDEFAGVRKRSATTTKPNENAATNVTKSSLTLDRNHKFANVPKPQALFEVGVDNFPKGPWKPMLSQKPHALVPLDQSIASAESGSEDGPKRHKHPYEKEILTMKYPDTVYRQAEPIMYHPLDTTSLKWVDTLEDAEEMLEELKKAKEIAIDLEHHDHRTYAGMTCLMQISTRDQDWVVDTLQPWRHKLEMLNEVFADPNILKVLHGAFMDVIWLQRDLGLYLVGYFDTFFAAQTLYYPQKNLASLLKKFANFDADKKYQLADWRMRPLPEEMLFYARSDTHFLLYVYDMMRNELLEKSQRGEPDGDLMEKTLQKCRQQSLDRYEYASFDETTGQGPGGWFNYVAKNAVPLTGEQFAVFRAVWKWRDTEARRADESAHYMLTSQNVMDIAQVLPPDVKALHGLLPKHAALARRLAKELWEVIRSARVSGRGGATLRQFLTRDTKLSPVTGQGRRTANGTPMDNDEVAVVARRLGRSQLFGDVPISTLRGESTPPQPNLDGHVPLRWQDLAMLQTPVEKQQAEVQTTNQSQDLLATSDFISLDAARGRAGDKQGVPAGNTQREGRTGVSPKPGSGKKRKRGAETMAGTGAGDGEIMDNGPSGVDVEDKFLSSAESTKANAVDVTADAGDAEDIMDIDGPDDSDEGDAGPSRKQARLDKRMRRKAKSAAKKLAKQAKAAQKDPASLGQDAVPFDYSQAGSVLHAKREPAANGPKVMDPYFKAAGDGPRGARRAPPLPGGRSATFKK